MVKKAAQARPNQYLRLARKEHGWTQKDVADRIGAPSPLNVTRWERGTAFPSAFYIEKLCQIFDKSARDLGLMEEEDEELEPQPPDTAPLPRKMTSPLEQAATVPVMQTALWNVPYRRNPFFTGRQDLLEDLRTHLGAVDGSLMRTHALSGLGGIGKTQLAVEYAYRFRDLYSAVFWVRGASRETLIADFVSIAELLQMPERDEQDQTKTVAALKLWLTQHQRWLLILDNADDLALAVEYLPTGGGGHVLLTTRAQATGRLATSFAVEKMDLDEGSLLLLRRARVLAADATLSSATPDDLSVTCTIVRELDGLPLALDQAGAYIEETGSSLAEYLRLFQRRRKDLLARNTTTPDYPHTVASTWSLAFQQVEQISPAAADLLRLCSFLDADAIAEGMLVRAAATLGPHLDPIVDDPFAFNEAIQVLRTYSLIRRDAQTRTLAIHRLVQVVLKDAMDMQTRHQWAERAICAVNSAFPEVMLATWQYCQECLPHAQVCVALVEQYQLVLPEAARLINHVGWYMRERGLYTQAENFLQHALTMREQSAGPGHLDTAATLDHLGFLYYFQGHFVQAEPILHRARSIRERLLGPDHPDTAVTMNHLALVYSEQGKYQQSEELYLQAFAICERKAGPEHPDTATTLYNLAWLYYLQARYQEAEPLIHRALTIREKVLGPDHPDTAESMVDLATIYWKQGLHKQAEMYYLRALDVTERVLGPEHSNTAANLNNLGNLYRDRSRFSQAEPLYLRAIAITEKVLMPDHPQTATHVYNLAYMYHLQGHYEQAEPLYQRSLEIREKVLGPDHLHTALSLFGLARLDEDQGRDELAEESYKRALAIRQKTLGPDHPETIVILKRYDALIAKIHAHRPSQDSARE